jgi:hypothetical protein
MSELILDQDPATPGFHSARNGVWWMTQLLQMENLLKGAELIPVAGVLTIPVDGGNYWCTPTADITSIVLAGVPTAPMVNIATVYFRYLTAVRSIASPIDWKWADKIRTLVSTKEGFDVELTLTSLPFGGVKAMTVDWGVPA